MGRFPVISISLKSVEALNYQAACAALRTVIGNEAMRFPFLGTSRRLEENDRERYQALIRMDRGLFAMEEELLVDSLRTLCQLLAKHYSCKVILLIDEYDVPLDKAFQAGYYEEMVSLIRRLFGNVLKTNEDLQFAVLTGCLRISRESIFTGLNSLKVHSVGVQGTIRLSPVILPVFCVILSQRTSSTPPLYVWKPGKIIRAEVAESKM